MGIQGNARKLYWLMSLALTMGMWTACGSRHGTDAATVGVSVQLALARATSETLDSLQVEVSGSGMATIAKRCNGAPGSLDLGAIPPGTARRILARGYAGGIAVQQGEVTVDLTAGESRTVALALQALFGYFEVKVPLGLGNPLGVSSGTLVLSGSGETDTLALAGTVPNRYFRSGALPLDRDYALAMELRNAAGEVLYRGTDTVHLSASMPEVALSLSSLVAGVSLAVTISARPELAGRVVFPGAVAHAPRALHDLLIVELLPNPKSGGDEWEYTEIYNATTDTLVLDSCRLAKDRVTTGTTTAVKLTGCSVPPGEFAVLGRDSVSSADCRIAGFTLSNSAQPVVVHCGSLLVDSIAYNAPTDSLNPFPLALGKSIEVPVMRYQQRALGSAWCAGSDSTMLGSLAVLGSPGREAGCL